MMKEHPYEFGGILFTIAVLGGILGGVAFDNLEYEHDGKTSSSGVGAGQTALEKYMPIFPKHQVYDNDDVDDMQECKKVAKSLQEFYDCVNG